MHNETAEQYRDTAYGLLKPQLLRLGKTLAAVTQIGKTLKWEFLRDRYSGHYCSIYL